MTATENTTHLQALVTRLGNERGYLAAAATAGERELRAVWIKQIEREIADEERLLGIESVTDSNLTDDELLAELAA